MSFDTGIPNIRVVIREASNENLTVDVPNVSVNIQPGSQYNVNIIPNTVTTLRTGSFNTYADFAGIAATASYISGSGIIAGFATSASYALNAVSASYVSGSTTIGPGTVQSIALFDSTSTISSSIIYQSSNKIGIGTTSPTSSLHVSSNATIVTIEDFNSGQPTSIANVEYKYNSGSLGYVGYSGLATGSLDIWNYYSLGNIRFGTNNIERVRIDSTGRIGIGTISPSASIQVQGNQVISASSNQTSSLDIAHTWSGSGVTYNSIKLNVTDTTSAVLSNLIDLQVGGSSKFLVGKTGRIDTQADIRVFGSGAVRIINNSGYFSLGAADDVVLNRDSADVLAQRRTTNPQTFRIYNTYTDASNFERATLRWTGNAFFFGTEVSGSGTASGRSLNFTSANGFINSDSHFVPSNTRAKDLGVAAALWRDIFVGRTINVDQGTVTADTPIISASGVWSGSSTTFTAVRVNITDSASSAASNLMNLQVGGTSQFSVSKIGLVTANNTIIGAVNGSSLGNNIIAGPAGYIGFGASYGTDVPGNVGDTRLFRDSASVFAQRNSTNPQTFRIYNTFTDLSNFERGILQWSSNVLNIGTENSGSGLPRRLNFIGNGISFASINANPATEVWRFNGSGHFVAGTDNTYDIGTSGALRPRHIYVAQQVNFGGSARISAAAAGALLVENNTGTSFDRLMFGGTTSTFPSLKRSGSALQVRLADDSGDGGFTAGATTFSGIQNNTNTTNSTFWNNGALTVAGGVGIGRDVNISGSVTILGLLTAVSQSTQYVTSSQLIVADNKIIVNVTDLQRFGGLSVIDSGSTSPATASIYWDSLNHNFIYENLSGSTYNSALFIAGPVNTGPLGNEPGLTMGRIPVASATDHIDSRIQSSSIRVDFPSRLTHIESGLVVTGSVTASGTVGIGGDVVIQGVLYSSGSNIDVDPTTEVVATVPSGSYDAAFFDYIIKKATNYRAGTVTAVWDKNGNIEHMDNSTNDLGSTAEVVLSLDSSGGNIRLIATVATNDWTVKSSVRAL